MVLLRSAGCEVRPEDVEIFRTKLDYLSEIDGITYEKLREDIFEIKKQMQKHDEDAAALAESNEELALRHCEASEKLQQQLEPLEIALETQKDLLQEQVNAKADLKNSVDEAEADLTTIKAMQDAASANEKLNEINIGSGKSAAAEFKRRKEEMRKRLVKAKAIREESNAEGDLEKETRAALGGGAAARLAKLKAKSE